MQGEVAVSWYTKTTRVAKLVSDPTSLAVLLGCVLAY